MIPLKDQNPTRITPYVNWTLILANIAVFIYTLSNGTFADPTATCATEPNNTICVYGLKPAQIINGTGYLTFLTSMFLHGGPLHIAGNMLYLWVFGDNIEDAFGHAGYLVFYLLAGAAASLTHIASDPASVLPAVGASGAISGVLGAYARYYPRAGVLTLFFRFFVRLPAAFLIGVWFLYQLLLSAIDITGGVAYFDHIGGFVAGLVIALIIPIRKSSTWQPQR